WFLSMVCQLRTSRAETCGCCCCLLPLRGVVPVLRSCARWAFASMFSFDGSACCASCLDGWTCVLSVAFRDGAGLSCANAPAPKAAQTSAAAIVRLKGFIVALLVRGY